jgi:ParB family chromosome partitioning protein
MQVGSLEHVLSLSQTVRLRLSQISSSKLKIRSELGDLSDLMQSIRERGLLSPIIVRRVRGDFPYELVTGARRLESMRKLGFLEIEAIVTNLDDRGVFEVFMIENLQRQTLTPLEEARAFYAYVGSKDRKCLGYGRISELARRIGKSQEYISNRMRLLRLPENLLISLFSQRNFKVSHAEELASLAENPKKVEELGELLMSRKISVGELEHAISLIKSGIETERALELAKVECDFQVEARSSEKSGPIEQAMLRRTKHVLESVLSYIDNAGREFEENRELYEEWLMGVRLRVHDAIDGVISCEKIYRKSNSLEA